MTTGPVFPDIVVPESRVMDPLTPTVAASADWMVTGPDDPYADWPLTTFTIPPSPDAPDVPPIDNSILLPDVEDCPTTTLTAPPDPPRLEPDTKDNHIEFPDHVVPEENNKDPDDPTDIALAERSTTEPLDDEAPLPETTEILPPLLDVDVVEPAETWTTPPWPEEVPATTNEMEPDKPPTA